MHAVYKLKEKTKAIADVLGMPGKHIDKICLGFADESFAQLPANTARLWSFERGFVMRVNTDKQKRNCFNFYALKGRSVLNFINIGNQETMQQMLAALRQANEEAHDHYCHLGQAHRLPN